MNFYFVYDEYTDVANPVSTEHMANMVMEVMKYPKEQPHASHILVDMAQQ
jgi:hypothetical protein